MKFFIKRKWKSEKKRFLSCLTAMCLGLLVFSAALATDAWNCPECGRIGNTGNYCGGCGHASPSIESLNNDSVLEKKNADEFRRVGNIVTLGHYEQDNNPENGAEEIEWIVLDYDEKEHKALLISRYGLDAKPYHTEHQVTWETCTLRTWLNGEFAQAAFSIKERTAILKTAVENGVHQGFSGWNTLGGNNTTDQIFLLSYHEASDLYFTGNDGRICALTDSAVDHGARLKISKEDGRTVGWWWLRSPGQNQDSAAFVSYDGSLGNHDVILTSGAVRPALWLSLDLGIF